MTAKPLGAMSDPPCIPVIRTPGKMHLKSIGPCVFSTMPCSGPQICLKKEARLTLYKIYIYAKSIHVYYRKIMFTTTYIDIDQPHVQQTW